MKYFSDKKKLKVFINIKLILSVQFSCSVVFDSLRPHELQHARPPYPSPTPRVYPNPSIESVMPSSHLILCRPLLLLPPIFPSIRVFSNESALHIRWPKYYTFSFSICPSSENPGLISFRMDWFNLLAVKGTTQESSPTPQFKTLVTNKTAGVFCCKIESLKIKARNVFVQIFLFLPQIGYCMLLKSRNSNNTVVI